jgi:predicted nucleotidyltransferase
MFNHHRETIGRIQDHFRHSSEVLAVLLTGSIAHGFERPDSDVDIAIVVDAQAMQVRKKKGQLCFFDASLASYAGGYVDGKYIDLSFIKQVAAFGSEPARFAFKDAQIIVSKVDGLAQLLEDAARYPHEQQQMKIHRFLSQFDAWHWYTQEAHKTSDIYLLRQASTKMVLFGCRLVLAQNRILYPYHKWLTKVVSTASDMPPQFITRLNHVLADPTPVAISNFYATVRDYWVWPANETSWPMQFMMDSELNWLGLAAQPPVDDL